MPLTPQDVANKEFAVAGRMKRGYDEEEVDEFLDEVEQEIARLLTENNELRARISALQAQAQQGAAPQSAPAAAPAPVAPPAAAPSSGEHEAAALRTLQLA